MRALARWGITPLLAAPLGAWAFGLGDIELQSALNQPFKAQIELVSATPEDLAGLRINLAGQDTFARYGVDRPDYLLQLEFRVLTERTGVAFVQVTSRQSITEPFVTLLVEATWPRGRSVKEYTVLLDPPVLLPVPTTAPPVQPAQTRPPDSNAPGGQINRPQPAPSAEPVRPQPAPTPEPVRPQTAPRPSPAEAPPVSRVPEQAPEGSYGPVQRAETLWAIAERFRPTGVSMNQMMVAMFEANPQAFGGNMNVLHVGAVLRVPQAGDLQTLTVSAANAEFQRQTDEWQNRTPQERRLVLVPPSDSSVTPSRNPAPAPAPAVPEPQPADRRAEENARVAAAAAAEAEQRRLLQLEDERLRNLQERVGGAQPPAAETPAPSAAPGVDLESEPLFADEAEAPAPAAAEPAPTPAPAPVVAAPSAPEGPSLVSRIVGWVTSPLLLIAVGVAALLLAALWFVRRRREAPEDVTGRWEALESEVDDENVRVATERLRRQAPEASIVVEEQAARPRRAESDASADDTRLRSDETRLRPAAQRSQRAAAPSPEETLSSQTVINLDQADPVAEADFHMAYGLYDQAAELVQKALDAAPTRRDLKLKLLEVFFVWGNKDAFLSAAQKLHKDLGSAPDADWDKVVIMGKQICPDERLFAEATSAGGHVDVDLQAGDSPLDLAFDEVPDSGVDLDLGGADSEFELEPTRELKAPPVRPAAPAAKDLGDSLDIGERTAAGLEAALLEEAQKDDAGSRTTPDLAGFDSLAVTQESPTIERTRDWSRIQESPTAQYASVDAPTVESPTIESAGPDSPTMETPTIETPFRREPPTVEQPGLAIPASDRTAEIDLDDLGLDVKDLEDLPQDLGDLPGADADTREQLALKGDDDLLSATGVTQVLRGGEVDDDFEQRKTSVLSDADATMLAPSFDDNTLTGTEVLEHRLELDESGDTSLVKSLRKEDKDKLDLNLDDLSAALHGADTVEQPRASSFSHDVFSGGDTPLDMDIGSDVVGADDPTGTEEVSPLDPQTMTEVGTKLDLARAYIDMGDPEGARSILEEVLDEGDPSQRREAQGLLDVLSA